MTMTIACKTCGKRPKLNPFPLLKPPATSAQTCKLKFMENQLLESCPRLNEGELKLEL